MLRDPYHTLAEVVHMFEDKFSSEKAYYVCKQKDRLGNSIENKVKFKGIVIDDNQVVIGLRRTKLFKDQKAGYLFARIVPWQDWIDNKNYRTTDTKDENGFFPTIDGLKLPEEDDRSTFGLHYSSAMVNRSRRIGIMHDSAYVTHGIPTKRLAQQNIRFYNNQNYAIMPMEINSAGIPQYEDVTVRNLFQFTLDLILEAAKQMQISKLK